MKKEITRDDALLRMASLCARSEQCEFDIRQKLRRMTLSADDSDWVITQLSERRFLDNARFAGSFARDKVKFAGWGPLKIREALYAKRIDSSIVLEAIDSIDPNELIDAITRIGAAKARQLDMDVREDKIKFVRYLMQRGFSYDDARKALRNYEDECK